MDAYCTLEDRPMAERMHTWRLYGVLVAEPCSGDPCAECGRSGSGAASVSGTATCPYCGVDIMTAQCQCQRWPDREIPASVSGADVPTLPLGGEQGGYECAECAEHRATCDGCGAQHSPAGSLAFHRAHSGRGGDAPTMRIVEYSRTYANVEYVLVGTDRGAAEQWARRRVPRGWRVVAVSAVRGRPENFSVRFRRGTQ